MKENEILDYYNENWNDYNKIVDMLHSIIDEHEEEVKKLTQKINISDNNDKINELQSLLLECQDKLDEETHKIL